MSKENRLCLMKGDLLRISIHKTIYTPVLPVSASKSTDSRSLIVNTINLSCLCRQRDAEDLLTQHGATMAISILRGSYTVRITPFCTAGSYSVLLGSLQ